MTMPAGDSEVRAWFEREGWEASAISCYDEEGVEGWRWTHPDRLEEFDETGSWDEPPAVSESMREFIERRDREGEPMGQSNSPAGTLEKQYVYRQRFTLEVIWATAASDDAFDDSLTELMGSIAENTGEIVIWRYKSSPVERMGTSN